MLGDIKVVVFDLDDTLCSYWEAAKAGMHHAFVKHAPSGFTPEQLQAAWSTAYVPFVKEVKGEHWYPIYLKKGHITRAELMRRALVGLGIESQLHADELGEAYGAYRDARLELFPESEQVLQTLKGKVNLGLITNGPADVQRQELETLGIEHYFDMIVIEGEMGYGKPSPDVFNHVRETLGATKDQILMVGNSYAHDIRPPIELGWKTAWIRRPTDIPPSATQVEQLPAGAPEPTMTIHDLREILLALGYIADLG